MLFVIDTADLDEIREVNSQGLVDGVTTNPSLLAKEKGGTLDIPKAICGEVPGPESAEVMAQDREGVVEAAPAGANIATIPFNVLEKLLHHPRTDIGLKRFPEDWKRSGGRATP